MIDPHATRLSDRLFAGLQHVLPKHTLSRFIHRLMRSRRPWLRRRAVTWFLTGYPVDMKEAHESDPHAYESFNAFFTRSLREDARPIDAAPDALVSPVDGTVSQYGVLEGDGIVQAKGHLYSLRELLAGDAARAARYHGGTFACIYLAPFNYHRIHMPAAGTVRDTIYVPGELFSVNAATARAVPRLFARNERVICDFSAPTGDFAMVFVGALFVGSIETVWCGEINPPRQRRSQVLVIDRGRGLALTKGAEAGRFNMGSTVILLFEPGTLAWENWLKPGSTVRMGQRIGTFLSRSQA